MSTQDKKEIIEQYRQRNLLITCNGTPEEKIFVEQIKKIGMLPYIKVNHKRDLAISTIIKIRDPYTQKVLYQK